MIDIIPVRGRARISRHAQSGQIMQEPCTTSQAQDWAPINIGTNSYQFINRVSGLCMDVRGRAVAGTPIDQWPCNTISNERWSWSHGFPDGFYPMVSEISGTSSFCLDVPVDSQLAGLGMQINNCNGTPGEGWAIAGPVT